jgi:rhomboid protease GluP
MFGKKRTGSILCPSCGKLVGISDAECLNCGRKNPGMWGLGAVFHHLRRGAWLQQVVFVGTAFLFLATLAVDPTHIGMSGILNLVSPSRESLLRFGMSGAFPIYFLERWWTIFSAGWLHGSLLHIAFNLYWVRLLIPEVAELYGTSRTLIIYTLSSAFAFFATSTLGYLVPVLGAGMTVGASAAIAGLVGAMVHYGRRAGSSLIRRQAWSFAISVIAIGFFIPRADHTAHIAGFIGGWLMGRILDPLKPERGNHTVVAVVCLALTLASVVASLVVQPRLRQLYP